MWYACPVDLIPFFFTFFFTLRSSSTGLIVGIFCHLIIALGKFIMPIDRPKSHENTIHLEGSIMFPSGDVSKGGHSKTRYYFELIYSRHYRRKFNEMLLDYHQIQN